MDFRQYFNQFINDIKGHYSQQESQDIARLVFEEVLCAKMSLLFLDKKTISANKLQTLEKYKSRLIQHEPVQYILGKTYFLDLELDVNPSVFIPRPETEDLVLKVCEHIDKHFKNEPVNILEVGTGSGCISIYLKKSFPKAKLTATDISIKAIEVAKHNANKNLVNNISFLQSNILIEKTTALTKFHYDIVISNPPYIHPNKKPSLDKRVVDFEPNIALFTGNDSFLFYSKIMNTSPIKKRKQSRYFFEIDDGNENKISHLLKRKKLHFIFHKDRFDNTRFVECYDAHE